MSWINRLTTSPDTMHGIFSPWSSAGSRATHSSVLASYQGPMREQLLALVERAGRVPEGTAEAARAGVPGSVIGRQVRDMVAAGEFTPADSRFGRRTLGMAASADPIVAAGAAAAADPLLDAAIRSNPIYGGVMGQLLAQRGLLPAIGSSSPAAIVDVAAAAAGEAAPMVDDVVRDVARTVASHSGGAATDIAEGAARVLSRADRIARFDDALVAALKLIRL